MHLGASFLVRVKIGTSTIYHYKEREATPPFNKVYLFSNNFATDDIISLSSEISNQINFSSLFKNWKFGYLSVIKLR
jgi:hypothetical protein